VGRSDWMTRLPGYAVSMHEDCSWEVRRVGASIKVLRSIIVHASGR
jgi:hypothetical protein